MRKGASEEQWLDLEVPGAEYKGGYTPIKETLRIEVVEEGGQRI